MTEKTIRYRSDVTRYFMDTEFMEDGRVIELLSVALVTDTGREYYAACLDADQSHANDWVRANVLPLLPPPGDPAWRTRAQIRDDLLAFFNAGGYPEIWAYFSSYDWVVFCQLFGRMVDLPPFMPMFCMDLKQLSVMLGSPARPAQTSTAHNALNDARWNREYFNSMRGA